MTKNQRPSKVFRGSPWPDSTSCQGGVDIFKLEVLPGERLLLEVVVLV